MMRVLSMSLMMLFIMTPSTVLHAADSQSQGAADEAECEITPLTDTR